MVIAGRKYKAISLEHETRVAKSRPEQWYAIDVDSSAMPWTPNLFAGFEPPGCLSEVELVVGYREIYLIEGLAFLRSDNTYTL